jgi:cathepsin L
MIFILLSFLVGFCSSYKYSGDKFMYLVDYNFDLFIRDNNIVYGSDDEYNYRKYIFSTNLHKIIEHNNGNSSYKLAINRFADITTTEFKNQYLISIKRNSDKDYYINHTSNLPEKVDWRDKGVVNPIKDQGQCGSCWAFSATSALESAWAIKYGKLYDLAEQELVDCDTNDHGCNGGLMDNAWTWLNTSGGMTETKDYPYRAIDGKCKFTKKKAVVTVQGYEDCNPNDEQTLLSALATQPVSVAINANTDGFMFYSSGIYNDTTCDSSPSALDHGVILVGYDSESYILRNSWAETWGENGYMRMARGNTCGVLDLPSFPVV